MCAYHQHQTSTIHTVDFIVSVRSKDIFGFVKVVRSACQLSLALGAGSNKDSVLEMLLILIFNHRSMVHETKLE